MSPIGPAHRHTPCFAAPLGDKARRGRPTGVVGARLEAVRLELPTGATTVPAAEVRGGARAGGANRALIAPPEDNMTARGTEGFLPHEPRAKLSGAPLSVTSLPHVWRARSAPCVDATPRGPASDRCRAAAIGCVVEGTCKRRCVILPLDKDLAAPHSKIRSATAP